MKIYQLSIFTYFFCKYTVNSFYLRKEADDSFILLNDNNYHDNSVELNLRYISDENVMSLTNENINTKKESTSPNTISLAQAPDFVRNHAQAPDLWRKSKNIYTINKLKRKKLNKVNRINKIQNLITSNQSIVAPKRAYSDSLESGVTKERMIPYNLSVHNSINIRCVLIQHINRKTCILPNFFDKTDITPSNKMNQLYHDYYYIHLDDKEKEFIKKFCRNYTNIDVNYKSIDYYSQTNKIYNDLDNNYTLLDNLLIGTTLYILYFAVTGNFNGICIFMTLSMFLITLNGVQNSLRNR
jgi:hypothetical protein